MYKKDDGQITLAEFNSPFGKLDEKNRWAKIARIIPWQRYETKYASRFCDDNGAPAIKFRMAMGTLIIKQRTGHSDEETLQNIIENPYMQYLIGLLEFTTTAPFSASSITNFRKYITREMINEINDDLFRHEAERKNGDGKDGGKPQGSDSQTDQPDGTTHETNKGTLMLDATCAPANITYPTDIRLLNESREKLEGMIDVLHRHTGDGHKPRTYRDEARRKYLQYAKNRKPRKETIRKAIKQQLQYVARDLKHLDKQLQKVCIEELSNNQRKWLDTIRELYRQQKRMYETGIHSVENRIVSIGQPHVRPIVRGKTNAATEFGAKVSISMVNGYAFVDKLDWDAYNEESLLIPAIEDFNARYGCYPEAVLADKLFRNRGNLSYCKNRGIRLSGPRLGRPPKETNKAVIAEARKDSSKRNAIEGKFGEGKTKYGLSRVMARLKGSSETVIALSFLSMNISRKIRLINYCFCKLHRFKFFTLFYRKNQVLGVFG